MNNNDCECPWFRIIIFTALATWFLIGTYEAVTTFSFSFTNIGHAFVRGFLYIMYMAFAFGALLAIALILILVFILLYFTFLYAKKFYKLKENQLVQEQENLIQNKRQELDKLQKDINTFIGTKKDINRTIDFAQSLFSKILNHCKKVITSNENLKNALREKYIKQATKALQTGKLENKSVNKLNKRLKDMTDTINRTIEQEKEELSHLSGLEKELIEKIKEVKRVKNEF